VTDRPNSGQGDRGNRHGHRPFRFGITFGGAPTRRELVEEIKKAEDSGFDVVCTADHISARLAVLPLLSTAAEVSSMRVSPMVIASDYRHPVVLARDAATIDILSEGRFELGIGTGWIKEQYDAAGLPYDEPRTRVDRFEEAIEIIKGCWTGEPFTFAGDHYQVDGVTSPSPVQNPRPPLLIAGSGRRMLKIAGREADIVGISPLGNVATGFEHFRGAMASSGERIDEQLGWIRDGAGDRFGDLEISVTANHLALTTNVDATTEELASAWGSTPREVLDSLHVFVGTQGQIRDKVLDQRERFGISYVVFNSASLDAIGPVVAELAGT
jgi:probable F420-dependent oxidoreductase